MWLLSTLQTETTFLDWSKLPDLVAVVLLAWAFASVIRDSPARVSGNLFYGWLLIVLHFSAGMIRTGPGFVGNLVDIISVTSLIWAGILFMKAALPYSREISSLWMLVALMSAYTCYAIAIIFQAPAWLLCICALLIAAVPLSVTFSVVKRFHHPLRWFIVGINVVLCAFLLAVQNRPASGPELALEAILFTLYLGCGVHFWYLYPRATAGAFITIGGFFAWASVFAIAPSMGAYLPGTHIESEVWNLPKYVVAIGMILLMLEDQIAHNKHLALHDELTGLPNRRLFQDRLANALERARRTSTPTALLVLDLDHFKHVNDTLGHHVGDLLLQHVAVLFGQRVRKSDTVARTGGDEFSVILEGPTSEAEAAQVVRSLQDLLKSPMKLEDCVVPIAASVGVAMFPDDAQDMESLCIAADLRMYENKRAAGDARAASSSLRTEPGNPLPFQPRTDISMSLESVPLPKRSGLS